MNNEMNKEDLLSWMLVLCLIEDSNLEWENFRDLSLKINSKNKLKIYFNKVFQNGIQSFYLTNGTQLYRARQIKKTDLDKIGVNLQKIEDKVFSMLMTEDEIKILKNFPFKISHKNYLLMKFSQLDTWSREKKEQLHFAQKKWDEYTKIPFQGFTKDECGVPPKKYRKGQRFSRKKDAFLYLALEEQTAITEVRPMISQTFSLAKCVLNKEIKLANFCELEVPNTMDNKKFILYKTLLPSILATNTDNSSIFYNITQHLSHYIKRKGFDGIIYKSSLTANGNNIMLFDEKIVTFISSQIISINDIIVQYKDIINN